jgi:4-hydroxybenzoate polyprenyltransferase
MTAPGSKFPPNHPVHLLRTLRPHQWVKSAFVFLGAIFSHRWSEPALLLHVTAAAAAFSAVASSTYVLNDLADIEKDKLHPEKRRRTLAAGDVSVGWAQAVGTLSLFTGLLLGAWVSREVLAILVLYLALNVAYTYGLRDVVILDVFVIATGFMLRILAGTVGVGITPSDWLLQCGLMITLFLGFAKRRAELGALPEGGEAAHRKVLGLYTPLLLDKFIGITATGVIMTYSLYTTDADTVRAHGTRHLIYTVPFIVYGIFRYVFLLHNGSAGDPARDIFRDKQLLAAVVGWFVVTLWMLKG